jgi:hypothetical protein
MYVVKKFALLVFGERTLAGLRFFTNSGVKTGAC